MSLDFGKEWDIELRMKHMDAFCKYYIPTFPEKDHTKLVEEIGEAFEEARDLMKDWQIVFQKNEMSKP